MSEFSLQCEIFVCHSDSLDCKSGFGLATVWGWNSSSGSGSRFRRFLCGGFSVFQYRLEERDVSCSGFGFRKTVPAVPVPRSVPGSNGSGFRFRFGSWATLMNTKVFELLGWKIPCQRQSTVFRIVLAIIVSQWPRAHCHSLVQDLEELQHDGKGGLSLRGGGRTETATTAETAQKKKKATVTVASWYCILQDQQKEGKVLSRTAETVKTAKTVMKASPLKLSPLLRHPENLT